MAQQRAAADFHLHVKAKLHIFFIAHALYGHITTSGKKSDDTIVFSDPNFLYDAGILAIREHLRQILRFSYLHRFSGPLGRK